jgi:HSP20 family protein
MLCTDLDALERLVDPWQELHRMNRSWGCRPGLSSREFPAVNVWLNGEGAEVTAELPGIDAGSVDISVVGRTLTLKGSRLPDELKDDESYHRRERWRGEFSRSFDLPFAVEADKVKARFSKGVLHVELPRAEAEKPRKIEIKSE